MLAVRDMSAVWLCGTRFRMGKRARAPSRIAGGVSPEWERRRISKGEKRKYAPRWSDASAAAMSAHLDADRHALIPAQSQVDWVISLLGSEAARQKALKTIKVLLTSSDTEVLRWILSEYAKRFDREGVAGRRQVALSFLQPLKVRRAGAPVGVLKIEGSEENGGELKDWIARDLSKERLRPLQRSKRAWEGLARWPLSWMDAPGVICYERAAGRIEEERGGVVDAAFVKRLVHTSCLPTAVASASDHYILVQPSQAPRFMTVEEVGRCMGLEEG